MYNEYMSKIFLIRWGNGQDGKTSLKDYGRQLSIYSHWKEDTGSKIVKSDTELVTAVYQVIKQSFGGLSFI